MLGSRPGSEAAPFELLYVDDGSSDGSSLLLDNLANQYSEVKVGILIVVMDKHSHLTPALNEPKAN